MESATIDIRSAPRNPNVRAYLAGGGAATALVAAAVVVFLGVAAFVGFNGLPFGADEAPDATVNLAAGVPEAAATAAAPTADAVAVEPATPSPAAIAEILASLPPGTTLAAAPGLPPGTPGVNPTSHGGPGAPDGGGVPTTPGVLGTTVGGVENAAGNLGLDLPLTDVSKGLTGPLDKTIKDAGNGAGGLLGDKKLGDKLTGGLSNATGDLLGPGGLTDSLLGKK